MTDGQLSLLDVPATRGASRKSDPATSREAGRSMSGHVLRDQQARVLGPFGPLGTATAYEVTGWLNVGSVFAPIKENVVSKRLGELVELGMLLRTGETRPGSSSRAQKVYTLTVAGREYLRDRSAA